MTKTVCDHNVFLHHIIFLNFLLKGPSTRLLTGLAVASVPTVGVPPQLGSNVPSETVGSGVDGISVGALLFVVTTRVGDAVVGARVSMNTIGGGVLAVGSSVSWGMVNFVGSSVSWGMPMGVGCSVSLGILKGVGFAVGLLVGLLEGDLVVGAPVIGLNVGVSLGISVGTAVGAHTS